MIMKIIKLNEFRDPGDPRRSTKVKELLYDDKLTTRYICRYVPDINNTTRPPVHIVRSYDRIYR